MFVRLPWIDIRRKLFTLVSLELAIYLVLNSYFFSDFSSISFSIFINILFIFLLLINYILGVYSEFQGCALSLKDLIFRGSVSYLVLNLFAIIYIYISHLSLELLIIFSFFLLIQYLLSYVSNYFISKTFLGIKGGIKRWYVIGSLSKFNNLLSEIYNSDINIELIHFNFPEPTYEFKKNDFSRIGFIVLEPDKLLDSEINFLTSISSNNTKVFDITLWSEIYLQRFPVSLLTKSNIILNQFLKPTNNIQYRIKRVFDVLVSLVLFVITFPFLFISSCLIKISDRGPILYKQVRTGLNNKPFTIYKLRTMKVNAETNGVQWSKKNDPRVTLIGNILRKTRIDELPQLVCVLNSDMSLIGPRPERPEIDNFLRKNIEHYDIRYKIKPGLSGWAQVNYSNGASLIDSRNKLSYDLYYMRNFNIFLDLLIFLKTIRIVFNASGTDPQ